MADQEVTLEIVTSLSAVRAADWDSCACPEAQTGARPEDPFTTYRFLQALEESGSVGSGTGWQPHYLLARVDGQLIGCAPMYLKSHSQGEYIFDHSWAHAYERAGGRYYPKLQVAVPFTPATGRRRLVRPRLETTARHALVQGMAQIGAKNGLSSAHIAFCTEDEAAQAAELGLMHRVGTQYHWHNLDYADFSAFLGDLSSRKRKMIRKERARAAEFGGQIVQLTGDQIEPHHWDAFWEFYQDTGARKWGRPYLTRAFFDLLQRDMRHDLLLVLALRNGQPVAGALNFIGRSALFGRYWGCVEDHPCLHFECCYYQAMDYAIAHGLARVEAGAQGEHKLARGYLPAQVHSLHWVGDPGFARAIAQYLEEERKAVEDEVDILTDYGPFRKTEVKEQE
ncbi:MAG: GNAT family N-acetyltransferase [Lutimaribacter sp.]